MRLLGLNDIGGLEGLIDALSGNGGQDTMGLMLAMLRDDTLSKEVLEARSLELATVLAARAFGSKLMDSAPQSYVDAIFANKDKCADEQEFIRFAMNVGAVFASTPIPEFIHIKKEAYEKLLEDFKTMPNAYPRASAQEQKDDDGPASVQEPHEHTNI